jgi:hypothetical protein
MQTDDIATDNRESRLNQSSVDGDNGVSAEASAEVGPSEERGEGVSRREMLKITAGAVVAAPLVGAGLKARAAGRDSATPETVALDSSAARAALLFFTPEEFALVDELTELIIPTDEHSPGARAAQCAAFIDSQLAEAWEPETKDRWRQGLALVNQLSQDMNGKPFMQATTEQRISVLTRMARNQGKPEKPEEHFFGELKSRTAHAYYTSKIGIHQEMEYKGNTYQKEFSGFDAT